MGAESFAPLTYTASIGISSRPTLLTTLFVYRALGLQHFKVKVRDADDIKKIRLIRNVLGRDVTVFADANAQWDREEAIRHIEALKSLDVWAVEEPLRSADATQGPHGERDRFSVLTDAHYENYRWLRARSPLPLIADESLICLQSARRIIEHDAFDILNVRLSKCGGPWVSASIVELARQHQRKFAVGAMVGETPILATAGAHFAGTYRDHLYVQGYSHRLLHRRRIARGEPLMRRGGRLQIGDDATGWGLRLNKPVLDAVTIRRESFRL